MLFLMAIHQNLSAMGKIIEGENLLAIKNMPAHFTLQSLNRRAGIALIAISLGSIMVSSLAFGKGSILALGDSLTFGYAVEESHSWPFLLSKRLGAPVVNAGTPGATSAFGASTLRFHLKRGQPSLVIYALGANDGLRGIDPSVTKKNIIKAIQMCKDKNIPVVILGMRAPPNYGKKFPKNFAKAFQEAAKATDTPLMPFFLEGVAGKAEYNQPDGIHPNKAGYKIIAENIYNFLKKTKSYEPSTKAK